MQRINSKKHRVLNSDYREYLNHAESDMLSLLKDMRSFNSEFYVEFTESNDKITNENDYIAGNNVFNSAFYISQYRKLADMQFDTYKSKVRDSNEIVDGNKSIKINKVNPKKNIIARNNIYLENNSQNETVNTDGSSKIENNTRNKSYSANGTFNYDRIITRIIKIFGTGVFTSSKARRYAFNLRYRPSVKDWDDLINRMVEDGVFSKSKVYPNGSSYIRANPEIINKISERRIMLFNSLQSMFEKNNYIEMTFSEIKEYLLQNEKLVSLVSLLVIELNALVDRGKLIKGGNKKLSKYMLNREENNL